MPENLFLSIAAASVTVAALHALAPDHWLPLAAMARAQNWSPARTARLTAACGFAHVTVSVVLGLGGLAFGVRLFERFGPELESFAGVLLVAFGIGYAVWGLRHAAAHLHGHPHHHYDHVHEPARLTPWTIGLLFAADPCLAVFPLMFAAAPLGWDRVAAVVVLYELATMATMVMLVLPARAAAHGVLRGRWMHRYGDAVAGVCIAAVGVTVSLLGW